MELYPRVKLAIAEHRIIALRCRVQQLEAHVASGVPPHIEELATNIRRNIKHMVRDLNAGDQHHSVLLDYLNHIDTLAQQIEGSE